MIDLKSVLALMDKHAPTRAPIYPLPEEIRRAAARAALSTVRKGCWHGDRLPEYVVRAIYADYLRTRSTAATGAIYGRSDVALRRLFRSHGYPLLKKRSRPAVLYDGVLYYQTSDGRYYRSVRMIEGKRVTSALHVRIYEDANGPTPSGHQITFEDGDSSNVRLENLLCLPLARIASRTRRRTLANSKPNKSHAA